MNKMNNFINRNRKPALGEGTHSVTFNGIEYRENRNGGMYATVHFVDYADQSFNLFADGENYQLDFLLEQLNETSYNPEDINKHIGMEITVTMYVRKTPERDFLNPSFNPRYAEENENAMNFA